jgi:hypothetical protein
MIFVFLIVYKLVIFHTPGGATVLINPGEVTYLRAARNEHETAKFLPKEVKCVISLVDGKFVSVLETCDYVRNSLEEAEKQ